MNLNRYRILALLVPLGAFATQANALAPYSPDANTTFLYHFDEAAETSVAANAGIAGYSAISYDGAWAGDETDQPTITSALGATGFAGFGNAATLTQSTGLGVDLDKNGAFRMNDAAPVSPDRFENHEEILGSSFTLEAMVNIASLDPGNPQEIISTDAYYSAADGGNDSRGFQFRIFQGNLEFFFIGSALDTGVVQAAIPTTGDHAFVPNEWFHAAVSFDGSTLSFYWTRVDESSPAANLIGTGTHTIDLTDGGPLVFGNEGRISGASPAVGVVVSNEGLQGLMDEARISNVARAANEFIFGASPAAPPAFTSIIRSEDGSEVSITWNSRPNVEYFIEFSPDLKSWFEVSDGFGSQGESTTFTDSFYPESYPLRGAYRVREKAFVQ